MFRNDRGDFCRELSCGAFLSLSALGPGLFTGREIAFYYAQTGMISWLGIVLCGFLTGIVSGAAAHFAKKTGARSFPQIFRRSMGVYAGGCIWTLHLLVLAAAVWIALAALKRSGELILPIQNAGWAGMAAGFAAAVMIAGKWRERAGIFAGTAAALFLALLLIKGRMPREAQLYMRIRLKIMGSWTGMLALALLHACRCAAVAAGAAAGFARKLRPAHVGAAAGGWTAVLLFLANGIFRSRPAELMALREPFAAMCGEWGKAGYFCAGGMLWTGAVMMLAGVVFQLRRLFGEEEKNGC